MLEHSCITHLDKKCTVKHREKYPQNLYVRHTQTDTKATICCVRLIGYFGVKVHKKSNLETGTMTRPKLQLCICATKFLQILFHSFLVSQGEHCFLLLLVSQCRSVHLVGSDAMQEMSKKDRHSKGNSLICRKTSAVNTRQSKSLHHFEKHGDKKPSSFAAFDEKRNEWFTEALTEAPTFLLIYSQNDFFFPLKAAEENHHSRRCNIPPRVQIQRKQAFSLCLAGLFVFGRSLEEER